MARRQKLRTENRTPRSPRYPPARARPHRPVRRAQLAPVRHKTRPPHSKNGERSRLASADVMMSGAEQKGGVVAALSQRPSRRALELDLVGVTTKQVSVGGRTSSVGVGHNGGSAEAPNFDDGDRMRGSTNENGDEYEDEDEDDGGGSDSFASDSASENDSDDGEAVRDEAAWRDQWNHRRSTRTASPENSGDESREMFSLAGTWGDFESGEEEEEDDDDGDDHDNGGIDDGDCEGIDAVANTHNSYSGDGNDKSSILRNDGRSCRSVGLCVMLPVDPSAFDRVSGMSANLRTMLSSGDRTDRMAFRAKGVASSGINQLQSAAAMTQLRMQQQARAYVL